jgi:transposase
MEIYARVERRRRWTAQEKAALLAEIDAEGGRVRLVARRHRIAESLLYNWRAARKAASAMMPTPLQTAYCGSGLCGRMS